MQIGDAREAGLADFWPPDPPRLRAIGVVDE